MKNAVRLLPSLSAWLRAPKLSTGHCPWAALVLAAGTVSTAAAQTAAAPPVTVDHITWLTSDNTGAGNPEASGVTARLITLLKTYWPGVQHEILQANSKRSWQMIEEGQTVCRANVVRNADRERIAYFTNTQLTPPPQIVVRRDKLALLPRTPAGEVQLPQLLADARLRGALMDARSYGAAVDDMVSHRAAGGNVTLYSPRDFGGRILQMISLDRADYSIEPDIALVMAGSPKDLVTVPIQGASELVMAGVACPRTPWGLVAIRGVDRALGRPETAADLRQGLMHWLTPETQVHYAAQFDQFYRERSKPSKIQP